jgi:hypothetical protein
MKIGESISIALRSFGNEVAQKARGLGELVRNAFGFKSNLEGTKQVKDDGVRLSGSSGLDKTAPPQTDTLTGLKQVKSAMPQFYEKRDMPLDPAKLRQVGDDAKLSNFPYTRDVSQLPPGWKPMTELPKDMVEKLGLSQLQDGTLVDPKSGLTANILVHQESKEVVVSFGGTTSGRQTGDNLFERSKPGKNFMTTLSQWGANFKAGLGGVPKSYEQAAKLTQEIVKLVGGSKDFEGFTVRTVGHSKGGGEAMYAALMQEDPLKCTAFCPSHLSKGLIARLPPDNVARSKDLVESYSPFGDVVSALRGKLPDVPGVGVGSHFPGVPGAGMIDLHDQFLRHVLHHCGT